MDKTYERAYAYLIEAQKQIKERIRKMDPKYPVFNPTLYMWQPYLSALNTALLSQQMGTNNPGGQPQHPPGSHPQHTISTPPTSASGFQFPPPGLPPLTPTPSGLGNQAAAAAAVAMARRFQPISGPPHFPLDMGGLKQASDSLLSTVPHRPGFPPEVSDLFPKMSPQQLAMHLSGRPTGQPILPLPTSSEAQRDPHPAPSGTSSSPSSPRTSAANAESLSKHTLQSTKWAINVWNTWANQKNHRIEQNKSSRSAKVPTIPELSKVKGEDLDIYLSEFIIEVRRFDGEMYPPDSLMVLCAGVQRFLREDGNRPDLSFLDGYDKDYPKFQNALGQVVKDLQDRGIGTVKRKADTFNQEMEKELWNKGVLSFHSPKGLSRAVYFYITKGFWLRSRGDHRNLVVEDLQFGTDTYGQYVELAQRYFHPKKEQTVARKSQPVRHYNVDQKICRVYSVLNYYCKLIPPQGPLYRKPIEERLDGKTALFGSAAIGVHALERIPSELATEAGFEGYFTSRSVWVSDIPCHCNKYVMVLKSSAMIPLNLAPPNHPVGHPSSVVRPPGCPPPPSMLPLNFNHVPGLNPHLVNPVSLASMVSHSMMASRLSQFCPPMSSASVTLSDIHTPLKLATCSTSAITPPSSKHSSAEKSSPMKIINLDSAIPEYSRKRKLSLPSPCATAASLSEFSPMSLPTSHKQQLNEDSEFKKAEQLFNSFNTRPLDLSQRLSSPESDSDAESSDVEVDFNDESPRQPTRSDNSKPSPPKFPNLEKHVSTGDQEMMSDILAKNEIIGVSVETAKIEDTNKNYLTLKIYYE